MEECGSESMSADIDAEDVWLLMGRDYRISRSIRLQWFFEHLNKSVSPKTDEELVNSNEELEVVSVLPVLPHKKTVIVPTTKLSFVGRQYRFVFCIDMSPSLASLDTETGNVLIDDVFENMKNTLVGLVQPFCIPGSSLESNPNLHLTVLAHTFINVRECQVLVQGYCVNVENVKFLLCQLKRKLQVLENSITEELRKQNQGVGEKHASGVEQSKSNETGLFYIIRDGLLALQLLPDNASAAIVVITDGVFNMENSHVAEALLSQVRNSAAVCSFIQVGSGYKSAAVGYGYVPHCTLMQFIATATSGAYLIKCPPVRKTNNSEMNIYHKALFCWNFQRDIDRYKIDSWNQEFIFLTKESKAMLSPQTQQTIRYKEFELQTKISSVLTVRSREGYITDGIRFTKDNKFIEVKLVWPWKEFVTIEYIAKAAWPFESMSHKTEVIVSVCGPYEFLVDITSTKQRNHPLFRKFVLQSFDQSMKSLETSDQLLVQLQMFPIHTAATLIPDAVAQGSPLYFMPPNSDTSVLALQYGNSKKSKSSEIQFANFWKPIVSMDTRTWSKWLHCHRISILLEHDRPVTKEVFTPASNKNYTCIHRRAAVAAFNGLLKRWCSFTLLENHSYIKFMTSNSGDKPSSFCVLRLKHKGLCIVIRLAFLAGTPGKDRIKEVEYLKEQLGNLRAPISKMTDLNSSVASKSQIELPCIIFLTKQFERILVKYDLIPDEVRKSIQLLTNKNVLKRFSTDFSSDFQEQNRLLQDQQRIPGSILSEYLFNQRWVWTIHANEHIVLEDRSVSQMLEAILKRRLYEGFHFSSSVNKGIISMVKEINVNVDSTRDHSLNCCVIQYVIFPPHSQVLKGCDEKNVQDDSNECLTTIDVEGHTQLVTEIWVEPQLGTMDTSITPLEYIHGMEYNNIPAKIFSIDAQIVTDMSTYMALHMSCRSHVMSSTIDSCDLPIIPTDTFQSSSLIKIPFLFDLLPVLKKSRLILSLYPLMKDDTVKDPNEILLLHLSDTLQNMTDYIVPLKPNSLNAIVSYICQRSNNNNLTVWLGDSKAPFMCYSNLNVEFICYVKSFGSRIIIIFVPKSIKDLDMVVKYEEKNIKNSHGNRRNLPIFIFECEYEAIITIPSKYISFEQDVIQDYSAALSESALTPRHLNQKLPENRSKEIACICQAVYDHYFWALVTSVYHCLQNGYTLDSDDVELSIELVCEEFTKEIDITDFIKTVCVHMQTVNTSFNTIEDIVFPEVSDQFSISNKKLLNVKKCSSSGSSSYLSSHGSLKSKVNDCENHFLKNEIKNLFLKILAKHFTSVPNNPYFMYFNSSHPEETSSVKLLNSQSSYSSHDEDPYSTSGPESDGQTESDDSEIFFKKSETPLFLHLTSSCHYKSSDDGFTMRPVSVTSLPTCIEDIFNKFDDHGRDIDIFSKQFKITLDLVCLTQPSEPEEGDEWDTPYDVLNRRNSSDSFYSESQEYHSRTRKRLLTEISKDESYMKHNDDLNGLTRNQKNAVSNVIEEINWLLKDEIASALRTHGPVVETSLDIVAEHVKNSPNVENCKFEKRYFKFVTGIETVSDLSSSLFIYELESVNLDGYILKRVGKYYCVVVENIECENKKVGDDVKQYNFQHRNKGHRRSQSDVTNSFQSSIKRKQTSTNEFIMSRSFSDSTIFLDTLHQPDLYKHVDPSSDKYLKQVNNDTVSKIQSMQSLISSDDLSARLFNEKKNLLEPNQTTLIDDESCEEFCETKHDDLEEDLQPSPDFWLFIHNCEESVNIYLHRRRCEHARNISHQTTIYNRLLETLDHICKVVNQRILLENLYSTNQCHNLLIAEDDYDRVWDETTENSDIAYIKNLDSNNQPFSSHADVFFKPGNLVQADFLFKPGSFECELVLQRNIPIHKRLRAPTQVGGKSRGLLAIHRELSKFRISNRKNIFVIKDKSNNVFYFKVNEIKSNRSQSIIILDEEFNTFKPVSRQLSPTSSYASLPKFEDQNDVFEESDQSTLISSRTDERFAENEQQDYIQFLVYGISEPDQTIKHEMIQMISNKLDNANLELISVSLIRNPKSKLTPEDVEFIQARKPLAYKLVLCVSNMAARFMHAIMFYLHQHLLLQYNTPKYSTTNPDYHFKNYTEYCSSTATEATIPSSDLFLYNRDVMKEESNIGIGVIYMSLVNLEGIKVVAHPCYPSIKYEFIKLSQQKDILSEMLLLKQLDSLTEADTNICKNVMIQFSIWERGNINKEMLIKSLITNTRYALSDVYIEYDLLCTPICFVPLTLQQSFQCSRRHSLVHPETCCSPHMKQGASSTSTTPQFGKKQMILRKFLSEPTTPCENQPNKDEIKDAPESYGSFEINVNDAEKRIPPVKKYSNDCSSSMSSSRPSLSRHSTLSDKDFQETLTGAVANDLNQAYYVLTDAECSESLKATDTSNKTWAEIEIQRRTELSIRKERRKFENGLSGDLHYHYSGCAHSLFDELINMENASLLKHIGVLTHHYSMEIVLNEVVKEFLKCSPDIKPKVFKGIRMTDGDFMYTQVKDHNESRADSIKTSLNNESLIPGNWCSYIVIGRNAQKWLQSMGTDESEVSDDEEGKQSNQEDQSKQKFKPLCYNNNNNNLNQDRNYLNDPQSPSCISPGFVPRQKFFMAYFEEKKISVYTYNFSNEVNVVLEKQLKRLYAWNNVRSHINNCLFMQKLGLFHHKHFVRDCPGKSDPDVLAFSRSTDKSCIIPLMRDVIPPKEIVKINDPPDPKRLEFDNVFRDTAPTHCLHHSDYYFRKDLIKRQAFQYLDVKNKKANLAYQQTVLKEIYNSWKQEGAHVPIAEERLQSLKKHCRLLHYCNASLLFDIGENKESEEKTAKEESSEYEESTNNQKGWYEELKWTLVQQYIQYLQTLGLCLIQVLNKNSQKAKSTSNTRNQKTSRSDTLVDERPTRYNLQKTSAGGIIVMEVFLERNHLCYSLLAFSSMYLNDIKQFVSPKDVTNFYRNCYEFKDLTHLQSFSYDFHIRMCQHQFSGRPSVFPKYYRVHKLMENILQHYPKPPRFSRLIITNGLLNISCTIGLNANTVYRYFITKASNFGLAKLEMSPTRDVFDPKDYLLFYTYTTEKQPVQFVEGWRTRRDTTDFDGFVAVHFCVDSNNGMLNIPFYLILVNKKEFYPRPHLLTSVSSALRGRHKANSGMDSVVFYENVENVKQRSRVRFCTEAPDNTAQQISNEILKYTPSWIHNSLDSDKEQLMEINLSDINSSTKSSVQTSARSSLSNISYDSRCSDSTDSDISIPESFCKTTSSTLETFLRNESKFVQLERSRVLEKLHEKFDDAFSHCWRDLCWHEILANEKTLDEETMQRKNKKKSNTDESSIHGNFLAVSQWRLKNLFYDVCDTYFDIGYDDVSKMFELVSFYKIRSIDKRLYDALNFISLNKPGVLSHLLRLVTTKYETLCRKFVSRDENVYVCILNPDNLDMFVLIDVKNGNMEISVVYRLKPQSSPLDNAIEENLTEVEKISRSHVENVITCLISNLFETIVCS